LLIRRAGTIMGMYTDWGNLKIVSCRAWLEGRTRQLNVCTGGMDALGASILTLRAPVSACGPPPHRIRASAQLGDAGMFRYSSICF
jgi:hypothetical protein